jgi:DNA polymerase
MSERRALESLLSFWSLAGVDAALADRPVDRTARPAEPAPLARRAAAPVSAEGPAPGARTPAPSPVADPGGLEEARRLAAQAADLTALEAAIAAFEGCPLKTMGASRAVFARGAPDAPVMVIGEGPGADEDLRGEPFVGRAGRLLDAMLAAAGLTGRVFITNTVFWRPPGNRTPTLAEQAVCAPFVERAIALVRPRALLLVGGAAAKAMLKESRGILSLRGRWFEWRGGDGALEIPAMPTLHPAFLLRQPAAKAMAWSDLLTLTERLDRPTRTA